jgi:hypothetical protein
MNLFCNDDSIVEILDDVVRIEHRGQTYEINRQSRDWLDLVAAFEVANGERKVDVGRDRNFTKQEIKNMTDRIDTVFEDAARPAVVYTIWKSEQLIEVFKQRGTYDVRAAVNNKIVLTRISDRSPEMIGVAAGLGEPVPDPVGEERKKKFGEVFGPRCGARTHAEAAKRIQSVRENYADVRRLYFGQPGDTAETAPPSLWLAAHEILHRLAVGKPMPPEGGPMILGFFQGMPVEKSL